MAFDKYELFLLKHKDLWPDVLPEVMVYTTYDNSPEIRKLVQLMKAKGVYSKKTWNYDCAVGVLKRLKKLRNG